MQIPITPISYNDVLKNHTLQINVFKNKFDTIVESIEVKIALLAFKCNIVIQKNHKFKNSNLPFKKPNSKFHYV